MERGLPLSNDNPEAAALFDRAVEQLSEFHADTRHWSAACFRLCRRRMLLWLTFRKLEALGE